MTRHPLDTPRETDDVRLRQYLKISRAKALHGSTRSLISRMRMRLRASMRVRAYARIARGRAV